MTDAGEGIPSRTQVNAWLVVFICDRGHSIRVSLALRDFHISSQGQCSSKCKFLRLAYFPPHFPPVFPPLIIHDDRPNSLYPRPRHSRLCHSYPKTSACSGCHAMHRSQYCCSDFRALPAFYSVKSSVTQPALVQDDGPFVYLCVLKFRNFTTAAKLTPLQQL